MSIAAEDHNRGRLSKDSERRRRYTVAQAAEAIGYSVRHFRVLYRTGKVPRPTSLIPGGKLTYAQAVYDQIVAAAGGEH